MNKKCYRTVTLPYRCNSYVGQVSLGQVTLGLLRNYIYKKVSQKENRAIEISAKLLELNLNNKLDETGKT